MNVGKEEFEGRMERFENACRRAGAKLTHQRMEVFREVARTGDHPDAAAVYKGVRRRVPTISLDTVYRTLWLLMDLGLLTTLGALRERVRFDVNVRPHHHFVCTRCGTASDFYHSDFDRLKAPEAVAELGSVETTHVEYRGICSRCSKE